MKDVVDDAVYDAAMPVLRNHDVAHHPSATERHADMQIESIDSNQERGDEHRLAVASASFLLSTSNRRSHVSFRLPLEDTIEITGSEESDKDSAGDEFDVWDVVTPSNPILIQYEEAPSKPHQPSEPAENMEDPASEWDAVNAFREEVERVESDRPAGAIREPSSLSAPIGYEEAKGMLMEEAAQDQAALATVQRYSLRRRQCLVRLWYALLGPPEFSNPSLRAQRDLIFVMAKTQLDPQHHGRLLQTIWRRLTGQTEPCPPIGSHWQVIGFQGVDPGTDLRGAGVFGLLQILFFARQAPILLHRTFALSRDDLQNFPFAIVSLNLTGMCLKVLREAKIYPLCRVRDAVIDTICTLYLSLFYDLYLGWKNQGKMIDAFPATRDDLERRALSDPVRLIAAFERGNISPLQGLTSPGDFIPESVS